MPHRLDPRLRVSDQRRQYRRDNRFELLLGLLAVLAGIAYLIQPPGDQSSVSVALDGPIDEAWAVAYALGGGMLAYGILRARIEIEAFGLWLLAAAIAVNLVAVITVRGPGIAIIGSGPLLAAGWACLARARDLAKHRRRARSGTLLTIAPVAPVIGAGAALDVNLIVLALLSGGLLTAVVAFFRFRKERTALDQQPLLNSSSSLGDAVEDLRAHNEWLRQTRDEAVAELHKLRAKVTVLEEEIEALRGHGERHA